MEYESRKVKWYWVLLYMIFCGGVAYLLFTGNPFLYSHLELRSALLGGDVSQMHTVPTRPVPAPKTGTPMGFSRYHFNRTGQDPLPTPRSRSYIETDHNEVDLNVPGFEAQNIVHDDGGFYLSGKGPWAISVGFDGKTRWRYRFLDPSGEKALAPILLDEASAYLTDSSGEVVCLDKITGQIRWVLELHRDVLASPFIWQKNLVFPVKGQNGIELLFVQRTDGQVEKQARKVDLKPGFLMSYDQNLEAMVATTESKVVALDPEDWSVLWSQTLPDRIKGPAVIADKQIFLATLGGKIVKLDGSKKGKLEWEADLEKPAASSPSYLPLMHKLSVLDSSGFLTLVDGKTGKIGWRTPTENRNPLHETWASRLKGQNIMEFKMDWLHKGWTIWSPCFDRGFCIYTPKGQMIQRITLTGALLSVPAALPQTLVFLTGSKGGKLIVSKTLEEGELKRLRAEAAKAEAAAAKAGTRKSSQESGATAK